MNLEVTECSVDPELIPDGEYVGHQTGYNVVVNCGATTFSVTVKPGVRGINRPRVVTVTGTQVVVSTDRHNSDA